MKKKMNKKIILGLAVTATAAALSFQVAFPLASSASDFVAFASEAAAQKELEVSEKEKEYDEKNSPVSESKKGVECTQGGQMPTPKEVTGWTFVGWYTKPLEYHFWGSENLVFGKESYLWTPQKGWENALEFNESKASDEDKNDEVLGNLGEDEKKKAIDHRNFFNGWLTKVSESKERDRGCDDDECDEECKKIEDGKFECHETYYPRYKPQKVKIQWKVDCLNGEAVERVEGGAVRYSKGYLLTSFRQYGGDVGDLFMDVGFLAQGRTLTGWRVSTQSQALEMTQGQWKEQNNKDYWYCSKPLDKEILQSCKNTKDRNGDCYDWSVTIKAVFEGETIVPDPEIENEFVGEFKGALQNGAPMDGPSLEEPEGEHVCKAARVVLKNATCTEPGIMHHYECSCGRKYRNPECTLELTDEQVYVAPHHTLVRVSGKKATCETEGSSDKYICSVCHKTFQDQEGNIPFEDATVPATGHHWSEYQVDGAKHYKVCLVCGKRSEEEAHTFNVTKATTEEDKHCTVCGYVAEGKHIHSGILQKGFDATCEKEGKKDYYRCSCGEIFEDSACTRKTDEASLKIAPLGHNGLRVERKDATCTSDGLDAYYQCSRCGELFADSACTQPTDRSALKLNATGHNWSQEYRQKGSAGHSRYCLTCGAADKTCAHEYNVDRATTEEAKACEVCGYVAEEKHVHSLELCPGFDATCNQAGKKNSYVCTSCGEIFADEEGKEIVSEEELTVKALGHRPEYVEGKSATCTAEGRKGYYVCSACGEKFADNACKESVEEAELVIEKCEHTWREKFEVNESGHWRRCAVCGNIEEAEEHRWNVEHATTECNKHCEDCGFIAEAKQEPAPVEPPKDEPVESPAPEADQSVESQPNVEEPEIVAPTEPEVKEPEVERQPEVEEPEVEAQPEVVAPAEPEVKEPEVEAQPEVAAPVEPEVEEPEVEAQPEVVAPAEPEVKEPEVEAQPEVVAPAEPEVADETIPAQPEEVEPKVEAQPEVAAPVEPEAPKAAEPETVAPAVPEGKPEVNESETVELVKPEDSKTEEKLEKKPEAGKPGEVAAANKAESKAEPEVNAPVASGRLDEGSTVISDKKGGDAIWIAAAAAAAAVVVGGAVAFVLKKRKN